MRRVISMKHEDVRTKWHQLCAERALYNDWDWPQKNPDALYVLGYLHWMNKVTPNPNTCLYLRLPHYVMGKEDAAGDHDQD